MREETGYDIEASSPTVTLSETRTGLTFTFQPAEGTGDGYCHIDTQPYGAGPCLIFRPDFEDYGFSDYQQNQRWQVEISKLKNRAGQAESLHYTVEMISLMPQPAVNVELNITALSLNPGDQSRLSAAVIPDYADDLCVGWHSDDENVATVDEDGLVTALSPGHCQITCTDSAGHADICQVEVKTDP